MTKIISKPQIYDSFDESAIRLKQQYNIWSFLSGNPVIEKTDERPDCRVLTVDLLDALQVVQRQLEVMCVHVLVERSHDGAGVVGVLQTQRVAQLVDRHQEQIVSCADRTDEKRWIKPRVLCAADRTQLLYDRLSTSRGKRQRLT